MLTYPPVPGAPPFMGTSSGTHYYLLPNPGPNFSVWVQPSSNATNGSASVSTAVYISDCKIGILGSYAGATEECLTGQYQQATFYAGGYSIGTRSWTMTGGQVYRSVAWGGGTPPSSRHWVGLSSADYSASTLTYLPAEPGDLSITCSAPVKDPNGNLIGVATDQRLELTIAPVFTMALTPGKTFLLGPIAGPSSIKAGDDGANLGMEFTYSMSTPEPFRSGSGEGRYAFAQKCSIDRSQNRYLIPWSYTMNSNGYGLDTSFPYSTAQSTRTPPINRADSDNPYWELFTGQYYTTLVAIHDQFETILIFDPPGPPLTLLHDWVPVHLYRWTWYTSASQTGYGGDWNPPDGDPAVSFDVDWPCDDFQWDQVIILLE